MIDNELFKKLFIGYSKHFKGSITCAGISCSNCMFDSVRGCQIGEKEKAFQKLKENRMKKNELFTNEEWQVLQATDKKYKWIMRNVLGDLVLCESKPRFNASSCTYHSTGSTCQFVGFNEKFKGLDYRPLPVKAVQFREDILDDVEKEYLNTVLKPLPEVEYIKLLLVPTGNKTGVTHNNRLIVKFKTGERLWFPEFPSGHMYKNMQYGVEYQQEKLGLDLR